MSGVRILRPGMFTTVQDAGRWGFQASGVPIAGAMDFYSHRVANALAGNDAAAATLEVTMMGPHIQFETDTVVAIAGATFDLTLDDAPARMNEPVAVRSGAILRFGARQDGARAYIGVAGGFDVPFVLKSRSTHVLTGMGGHQGRPLRADDRLATGQASRPRRGTYITPLDLPRRGAQLRVIANDDVQLIAGKRFVISPQSNRMGYRLQASEAEPMPAPEMISRPVPTGAIQVPPNGQPMLLMNDHATTGGYLIAATVITADLPVAGQLAPGDWIEFQTCTTADADDALRAREEALRGAEREF